MNHFKSAYTIQMSQVTSCPKCGSKTYLLLGKMSNDPAFYICFNCTWVGQLGIGEVVMSNK